MVLGDGFLLVDVFFEFFKIGFGFGLDLEEGEDLVEATLPGVVLDGDLLPFVDDLGAFVVLEEALLFFFLFFADELSLLFNEFFEFLCFAILAKRGLRLRGFLTFSGYLV